MTDSDQVAAVRILSPRVTEQRNGEVWQLMLRAHNALNDRQARWFLVTVAIGPVCTAAYWWSQGMWPIVPFAGLEWLALYAVLRWVRQRGASHECIWIDAAEVRIRAHIEGRGAKKETNTRFPRHWSRVRLRAPDAGLHPSRLCIESQGRSHEVGEFLPEDERRVLAARLKQLVGEMNDSPAL